MKGQLKVLLTDSLSWPTSNALEITCMLPVHGNFL